MWQANVTINNNTSYNLIVDGIGPGNTAIGSNSSTSWVSTEVHNTKNLLFWIQENVWFMQGNLSFGPEAGVYVDRGWMTPEHQTIELIAEVNGSTFTYTENGGSQILAWNAFEQGGDINLTFNNI